MVIVCRGDFNDVMKARDKFRVTASTLKKVTYFGTALITTSQQTWGTQVVNTLGPTKDTRIEVA